MSRMGCTFRDGSRQRSMSLLQSLGGVGLMTTYITLLRSYESFRPKLRRSGIFVVIMFKNPKLRRSDIISVELK
jgi:hypothetical protein